MVPLVLVHNDVVANPAYQWDDVEGVHYHYPSKYRSKIRMGEPFVYYHGVHRANGKRGPAQYVGSGTIGEIWADPARRNAWYCRIDDYERFSSPVSAKIDGANRENIPRNMWRDGVRVLDAKVYADILREAATGATGTGTVVTAAPPQVPEPSALILPAALSQHQNFSSGYRRSPRSKAIGDWAEQAALAYLQAHPESYRDCTHRAGLGETPGWDIDYRDGEGLMHRVEVKGTTGAAFAGVELTANEMAAAKQHADQYWLCLVASCETGQPSIQFIKNPVEKMSAGEWSAYPTVYAVRFNPG